MALVLDEILDSFYETLSESEAVSSEQLAELRKLFESGRKLKADDFVAILSGREKEAAE